MPSGNTLSIPHLLKQYGIRPDKRLGQNFLVDQGSLEKIIAASDIQPTQHVLEIGPGLGSLTRHLAGAAAQVVAVEIDAGLLPPLQDVLAGAVNVRIVHGDILELRVRDLIEVDDFIVVANIPYYITSAIIRHLLEARLKPIRIILTIQEEVARRVCAGPGDLSLLALSVQVYGAPRIVARIPAGAFYPAPNVDSAVVRIELYPQPLVDESNLELFFRLIHAGFAMKRKTLRNTLSAGMHWDKDEAEDVLGKAGIDPRRRAQALSMDEWRALVSIAAGRRPDE
jgi:16S rRNA (adenine1518-N6/adenine1519-N6)-dimethyltransferase